MELSMNMDYNQFSDKFWKMGREVRSIVHHNCFGEDYEHLLVCKNCEDFDYFETYFKVVHYAGISDTDCDACLEAHYNESYVEGELPHSCGKDRINQLICKGAYDNFKVNPCKVMSKVLKYFRSKEVDSFSLITTKAPEMVHKSIMKNQVHEELIAAAMHPSRIMKQMEQFEDIEDFFDSF